MTKMKEINLLALRVCGFLVAAVIFGALDGKEYDENCIDHRMREFKLISILADLCLVDCSDIQSFVLG